MLVSLNNSVKNVLFWKKLPCLFTLLYWSVKELLSELVSFNNKNELVMICSYKTRRINFGDWNTTHEALDRKVWSVITVILTQVEHCHNCFPHSTETYQNRCWIVFWAVYATVDIQRFVPYRFLSLNVCLYVRSSPNSFKCFLARAKLWWRYKAFRKHPKVLKFVQPILITCEGL